VVCDEGDPLNPSTLQIIDVSDLPNSVNTVYDSYSLFKEAHNIYIDTATAKLYACASNTAMDVYDLSSPTNPTLIYSYNEVNHVHDAFVRNDTAFLNCGNQGLRVLDFSMVNTIGDQPTQLATFTSYPDAGYNHSGWLNNDGTLYIMQDENHGYDVKILDVTDLNNISVLATFNSGVDSQSMAHNGIIKGNLAYIPYYHDGLRVFDISDPYNPIQTWEYDTYSPNNHSSYKGAWGVYPYLPSGNIIVSDMQTGLYLFECGTPTSIIENKLTHNLFPNPTKAQFIIKNSNAKIFTLYNSLGIKVLEQEIHKNQNTIYREGLSNGLYFYTLNTEGKLVESGKVIFE
jgi:choice-of-anchor B domain-containing protein